MDVDRTKPHGTPDGLASKLFRGIFGAPVEAYHGAIETQGRGGLHAQMHLWLLHPLRARVIDKLRSGSVDAELVARSTAWRLAVRQKVGSVQFDGVEEVGRQLGMERSEVTPLPCSLAQQSRTCHRGQPEVEGDAVLPPPLGSTSAWATDVALKVPRQEPSLSL